MNHCKKKKKLNRTEEERRRLKIDLARALIKEEQIITFEARGKWFRPFFDRLVTYCKRAGDDNQLAFKRLRKYLDEDTSRMLIEKTAKKFSSREGGYTQFFHLQQPFSPHRKIIIKFSE